jgi:membrane-associated protease RseP (regulator of RpoE activity)
MLNELASSMDDQPALRTPPVVDEGRAERTFIREMVHTVMEIERELTPNAVAEREAQRGLPPPLPGETERDTAQFTMGGARAVISFTGRLSLPSEDAYARLDDLLRPHDLVALFRERRQGSGDPALAQPAPYDASPHIIHVLRGRVVPRKSAIWVNVVLFLLTVASVLLVGISIAAGEASLANPALAAQIASDPLLNFWRGLPYAFALLLILGAHELGHYFAGRYHRLAVTLPYFIPAPPFISPIGTAGAFIQLREPMRNRKVLLDVGAAGPLCGLAVCIPILFIGLATSPIVPLGPGLVEGNSLLYALAKSITFGRFVPDGSVDVLMNQFAQAGWTGLLVTALNLIPIGQLDGGHILFSLIGQTARRLFLPVVVLVGLLALFVSEAWLFWALLLLLFGRVYATPLDTITRLDARRRGIALLALVVFVVTFVPVPFTFRLEGAPVPTPDTALGLLPVALAGYLAVRRMQALRGR